MEDKITIHEQDKIRGKGFVARYIRGTEVRGDSSISIIAGLEIKTEKAETIYISNEICKTSIIEKVREALIKNSLNGGITSETAEMILEARPFHGRNYFGYKRGEEKESKQSYLKKHNIPKFIIPKHF